MSFDMQTLGRLFELSREAVMGVREDLVLFSNPAAVELLGLRPGDSIAEQQLNELLSGTVDQYAVSMTFKGIPVDFTVERIDDLALVRASRSTPLESLFSSSYRSIAEFGVSLAAAHHAADAILGEDSPARDSDSASSLYRSLYRLRRLHKHLMLAQNISEGTLSCNRTPVDLCVVLSDLYDSVSQTVQPLGRAIRFQSPDRTCFVKADADLIETMVLNLLTNSLIYTKEDKEILLSLSESSDRCVITVNDHGSGIDPAKLPFALEGKTLPALNDIKAGAGLGLYIARGIAEAHEGSILLESRSEIGTTIRISLPRLDSKGVRYLRQPVLYSHLSGMNPVLTELSVCLGRQFFKSKLFD